MTFVNTPIDLRHLTGINKVWVQKGLKISQIYLQCQDSSLNWAMNRSFYFFLNVFTEFAEFSDIKYFML